MCYGNFNPLYRFSAFTVRPGNAFAEAVCMAVANRPDGTYAPVFIYGSAGAGKTHLLHAVGLQCSALYPKLNICYLMSETFAAGCLEAGQQGNITEVRHTYLQADMLLFDDFQRITGNARAQEEFLFILDSFISARRPIIVTCDKPPREIKEMEDHFRVRFSEGIIAGIQ